MVNIFNKKSCIKEFVQSNFNHNILMSEFEIYYLIIKINFMIILNLMIESLNKSNIQKINSDIIIDYLKKSS